MTNKRIAKFLKGLVEELNESKGRVEVVFKSGKDTIRMGFKGRNRYMKALKEVLKHEA